jgi:hypothetical protein
MSRITTSPFVHTYDGTTLTNHQQQLIIEILSITSRKEKDQKSRIMAQQYVSSVPSDGSLKPGIASFFESFYAVSDTAAAHEQYADHFTSDAKLIMASKETSGRDGKRTIPSKTTIHSIPLTQHNPAGIIEMRHGMWEKVASRSHKPSMIYTFGKGGDDVMLHGTVDYELKDGKKAEGIEWAARAKFGSEHGNLKMVFYQVYLVSLNDLFNGIGRVVMLTWIALGHCGYDC